VLLLLLLLSLFFSAKKKLAIFDLIYSSPELESPDPSSESLKSKSSSTGVSLGLPAEDAALAGRDNSLPSSDTAVVCAGAGSGADASAGAGAGVVAGADAGAAFPAFRRLADA